MRREEKDLMETLDEEIDRSIKKFRNAMTGAEVRTFITEYEELMLKKSMEVVNAALEGRKWERCSIKENYHGSEYQETVQRGEQEKKRQLNLSDVSLIISAISLALIILIEFVIKR